MLSYALVFLLISVVAAALGFGGIAGTSASSQGSCSLYSWSCS